MIQSEFRNLKTGDIIKSKDGDEGEVRAVGDDWVQIAIHKGKYPILDYVYDVGAWAWRKMNGYKRDVGLDSVGLTSGVRPEEGD